MFRKLLFCLFLLSSVAQAQTPEHVPGQILVSLHQDITGYQLERSLSASNQNPGELKTIEQVSPYMNIWLMEFNEEAIDEQIMLRQLKNHPKVAVAQFNHVVSNRAVPNDALFEDQWQYVNDGSNGGVVDADIDADEAWEITTGGLTPMGDEIVAAVLDDGIDMNHPDFGDNRWTNVQEIPDNGIDDDGNGYIDDFEGWSTVTNNDNIAGGGHGTPVAGIIGAQGNNEIGVTGVNWDVKVMVIKNNFNTNEAAVISAYSYALTMRQLYNETNGQEGAFVVSTNASWGVNFGDPNDAPLWCEFYNVMGEHGILSCGATINGNENVDIVGDLPTACPGDFLITVTNCDNTDTKVTGAGYGAESIDLGAHGANAFTTALGQTYGGFGGTSGATPHVTGAIALLYSAPCPSFIALAKSDPAAAALLARQYILEGVDPNESLEGITVTGGRLNLKNSLDLLMADCATSGCFDPYGLTVMDSHPEYTLMWEAFEESQSFNLRYRQTGSTEWVEVNNLTETSHSLSALELCTEYEFQIQAICEEESSEYTDSFVWTTDGCCEPPAFLVSNAQSDNTIDLHWDFVLAAENYDLQYRLVGTDDWTSLSGLTDTTATISGLNPCTAYEVQVRTNCVEGTTTDFTPIMVVTTTGCGSCTALPYCEASSENASEEWIDQVILNTLNNVSGSDDGYGDFTHLSTEITPGELYEISVTPGFSGDLWEEYITAWIDFDQNGTFDNDEIILDSDGVTSTTETAEFEVPEDAETGGTRMRITMRYNQQAMSCDAAFNFGEVEDYCVFIADTTSGIWSDNLVDFTVFPNPASDLVNIQLETKAGAEKYEVKLLNALGQEVLSQPVNQSYFSISISGFPSGMYFIVLFNDHQFIARKPVIINK